MSGNVASVAIDSPLPHLDKFFDYLIPEKMLTEVSPGVRVRVKFHGRRVDGLVVAVSASSNHPKSLSEIEILVSGEPVLTDRVKNLVQVVASRTAGSFMDIAKVAIPPRHARAEKKTMTPHQTLGQKLETNLLAKFPGLLEHLELLKTGKGTNLVVDLPAHMLAEDWIAELISFTNGNLLAVLPDQFDCERLITKISPFQDSALISAHLSPELRYTQFLKTLRSKTNTVIGTRNAAFAPMSNPLAFLVLDDGDDLLTSLQAPYWNARDVLAWRADLEGVPLILVSRARSIEVSFLVESKWATAISVDRQSVRENSVKILTTGDDFDLSRDEYAKSARIPEKAFKSIQKGIAIGSVLIVTPRRGYLAVIACASCKEIVRCTNCQAPMAVEKTTKDRSCRRCGKLHMSLECENCGSAEIRAVAVGVERTVEEFGKAFPRNRVLQSNGDARLESIPTENCLVISTPGAEPIAEYSAAVILDAHTWLSRPDGNSRVKAIRQWMHAASLVKRSGEVVIVGNPDDYVIQSLVRWDPNSVGERILAERTQARLAPSARTAEVLGDNSALLELKDNLPNWTIAWGPVTRTGINLRGRTSALLVTAPKNKSDELVKYLRAWQVARSAKREAPTTIKIDPDDL